MIFIVFIIILAILYFPTKYIAQYFDATRTGFLPIIIAIFGTGLITNYLEKLINQQFIAIIVSFIIGGWVFQWVLGAESYKKGFLISLCSQIAIIICSIVILGGLAVTTQA